MNATTIAASAAAAPQKLIEVHMRVGFELLDFVSRRMKAQADLYDGMSHCRDMDGLVAVQQEFWSRTSKDYADEINNLSDVAQRNLSVMTALLEETQSPLKRH